MFTVCSIIFSQTLKNSGALSKEPPPLPSRSFKPRVRQRDGPRQVLLLLHGPAFYSDLEHDDLNALMQLSCPLSPQCVLNAPMQLLN